MDVCTKAFEAETAEDLAWLMPCAPALNMSTFGTVDSRLLSLKSAVYGQISYVVVVAEVVVVVLVSVVVVVLSAHRGSLSWVPFRRTTSFIGSHSTQHVFEPLMPAGTENPLTAESVL